MAATYEFGEFELDETLYQLRRAGEAVRVEPKVFDLLSYLLKRRDRVVSKDELLDELWPGASSDAVISRYVADARKAVADSASGQKVIKTVHGRGYRFVADVLERSASRAAAVSDAPPLPPESQPEPGVFVGRSQAMAQLERALSDALGGRGRLVLLVGEPGIGKTRTASELATLAKSRGARVITGRSYEGEGAPAFWPWVQILRSAIDEIDRATLLPRLGSAARDVAQLVPELLPGSVTASGDPDLAPEQARFRLFDGITTFLKSVAHERPLVVVIDDVHWADKASLLLLQFLAREISDCPLLVLGTYRDVELRRQHPLAEILGGLAREAAYQRITLRGLGQEDVTRYLELVSGAAAPRPLAEAVYEMTEGNPFFMEEVVRLLEAENRLHGSPDDATRVSLPQGVREAIGRRLDALSRECNDALSVASVIGRSFSATVLERAAQISSDRLLEVLDEAAGARVVVAAGGAQFAFSHALVRETLYEELSIVKRVQLHRRIGEILEEAYRMNPGPHLAEIAHHFFQAAPGGNVAKAVAYTMDAATRANEILSYEEAALHYRRAIETIELGTPVDETARCEALLGLAGAEVSSGERDSALAAFERAAAVARQLGRADLLARAALGFGGPSDFFGMPDDDKLQALLEEAHARLSSRDDAGLRAGVLARLASTGRYSESMAKRRELSRRAVELARETSDPAMLARALGARLWSMLGPDDVEQRLDLGEELIELAKRTGDRSYAILGHEYRFSSLIALGDVNTADREIETLDQLATEVRRPADRWLVLWLRASRAMSDGRFTEAERLIQEAFDVGQQAQHPGAELVFGGQMLWLAHERGNSDVVESGLSVFEGSYPWAKRLRLIGQAFASAHSGRLEDATRQLEGVGTRRFEDLPRDEHWLVSTALLAMTCRRIEHRALSEALYDLLLPYSDRVAVHDMLRVHGGAVAYYLGLLATTLGVPDRALEHFDQSLVVSRRLRSKPYTARTELEIARCLARRGRAGDRERALGLRDAALAVALDSGMVRVADECRSLELP